MEDRMSAAEKKAFYDSLPPEIREEVMAQEHMQQKAMTKKIPWLPARPTSTRVVESSPVVVVNDAPTDHNASAMTNLNLDEGGNNIAMKKPATYILEEDLSLGFNDDSEAQDLLPLDGDDGPLLNLEENDEDDASKSRANKSTCTTVGATAKPTPPSHSNPTLTMHKGRESICLLPTAAATSTRSIATDREGFWLFQTQQAGGVAAEKPLDRLRKAKELLNEGLIEQKNTTR